MDIVASSFTPKSNSTGTHTHLHGQRLLFARVIWMACTAFALWLLLFGVPALFAQLRVPAPQPQVGLGSGQLYAEDAALLNQIGISLDTYALLMTALHVVVALISLGLGAVIFWRKSNDWMAMWTSLELVFIAATIGFFSFEFALIAQDPMWRVPAVGLLSIYIPVGIGFLYVFPDGRFIPRWTRWCLALLLVYGLICTLFPASSLNWLTWSPLPTLAFIIIFSTTGAYAQVYRYQRVATVVQRQQTKWVVFGLVAAVALAVFPPLLLVTLFGDISQPGFPHLLYSLVFRIMPIVSEIVLVFSIGFSILRYRIWDIDLVINRSLVYGSVTALLAVIFVVTLLGLQTLLETLTNGMPPPFAPAVAALMIGGLFQPTRRRVQRLVDRRLYGFAFDAERFKERPSSENVLGALVGTQLGAYQLLEPIGKGGMGEVYKGLQPTLNRFVAVKVLPRALAAEAEFRTRFEREARVVALLNHPHIVHIIDFGQTDDLYYMVMQLIEGQDLSHYLKVSKRLSLPETCALIEQLASALDYAHEHGIVHRDLKPSNVMLRRCDEHDMCEAVLMDFGIAKVKDAQTRVTGSNSAVGTLDYMAPEQIVTAREVDHRADVYALGVLAYQMLTGELPFSGSAAQVMFAHLQQPIPDPRTITPELPEATVKALKRALAKKPDDRFASAGEFAHALC